MKLRLLVALAITFTVFSALLATYSITRDPSSILALGGRETQIQVFPDDERGNLPAELFGQQVHYQLTRFWSSDNGAIEDPTVAFIQPLKVGALRWPGGLSTREYRWAQTIGPLAVRGNLASWIENNRKIVFGVDELIREGRRLNASVAFTISLNSYQSAEEAADLVEYANGQAGSCANFDPSAWLHGQSTSATGYQPGSMPAGYYACLRAHPSYGNSTTPYSINYWEVGNEDYFGPYAGTPARTKEEYGAVVQAFSSAIKARVPGSKIAAVLWPDPRSSWNTAMYALPASTVDAFILHGYSTGSLSKVAIGSNYEIQVPFTASGASLDNPTVFRLSAHGRRGNTGNANNTCPWPNMRVKVNQANAQDFSVSSENTAVFTYNGPNLPAGSHTLQIGLTNDCYQQQYQGDTNLYVDKVERQTNGGFAQVGLIAANDFARVQAEDAFSLVREMFEQAAPFFPGRRPPILATEYNSAIDPASGNEADLNRSLLSTFYVATFFRELVDQGALGANPWLLQELCNVCRRDLIYYSGDATGSRKEANGTPFGNANYWFFRQIVDSGPLKRLAANVVNPEHFRPPTYINPNPRSDVPYVQTWAVKRSDGSVRIHVIYAGDEELNLRLTISGYNVQREVDVAQLRAPGGDLTRFNSSGAQQDLTSLSNRLTGGQDQTYLVAPASITSFTYYPPGLTLPPPGGGGGSIFNSEAGPTTSGTTGPSGKKSVARSTQKQGAETATPPVLDELIAENQPHVMPTKTRLIDNPWVLPAASAALGLLAISFWVIIAWKRHLYHQYLLAKTGFI